VADNEKNYLTEDFYDVKNKKKCNLVVSSRGEYGDIGRERYVLFAIGEDGRRLTKFVAKALWEKYTRQVMEIAKDE